MQTEKETLPDIDETKTSTPDDDSAARACATSAATVAHWTKTMRQNSKKRSHISEPATSHRPSLMAAARSASFNSVADDSVFYSQQQDEIMQTARGLCRDYICYRLKRSGYRGRVVIVKFSPAKDQELSFDVLSIGKALEDLYPHLFRNLARQLGYVLRSDEELRILFQRLALNVMGPDEEQFRWGRVLALLAIAGSLSVDCIAQGHAELIENMVTIFCEFVQRHLLGWIVSHGGWDGMATTFAEEKRTKADAFIPEGFSPLTSAICVAIFLAGITVTVRTMSDFFTIFKWVYES